MGSSKHNSSVSLFLNCDPLKMVHKKNPKINHNLLFLFVIREAISESFDTSANG